MIVGSSSLPPSCCAAADAVPGRLCLPTLPLPPLFMQRAVAERTGGGRSALRCRGFRRAAHRGRPGRHSQCATTRPLSPAEQRRNIATELSAGFPFSVTHTAALAELLAGPARPGFQRRG